MYKIRLQRYIPGRANKLTLPIKITDYESNQFIRMFDPDVLIKIRELTIWTSQERFDPYIQIPAAVITPGRPFRIFDLEKMFSNQVSLHRRYNRAKMHTIVEITENMNSYLSKTDTYIPKNANDGKEGQDLGLTITNEEGETFMSKDLMDRIDKYRKEMEMAERFDSKIPFKKITPKHIQQYGKLSLAPEDWLKIQKERVETLKKQRVAEVKQKYRDIKDYIDDY